MAWAHNARRFGILSGCLIAGLWACNDDHAADHGDHEHGDHEHEHGADIGKNTGATCPDDSTLTWENFGEKFMEDYCLRCHSETVPKAQRNGAPEDHNFDMLAEVDLLSKHIDQYAGSGPAATNTKMPPSGPFPSLEERKKLSEWIACDRPE